MKMLARLFSGNKNANLNTFLARERLSRTMPGETGAMASLRLTGAGL